MSNQYEVNNAPIVKIDEDKKLVFGWASIIKDENGMILVDRQDDFIDSEEELEKAAYEYVLHSRDGGEMHVRRGVAKMVESVVFTEEKQRALGIPVGSMPTGWWIGFKVNDERVWQQVKKGEYMGFSVHGTGQRESTELPVSKITEIGKAETKKKNKIATVMREFKAGKLKSSSGEPVTDPKQAMAIAISEQKKAKMSKVDLKEIVAKTEELVSKGDRPGHPFRGNQYTGGKRKGRSTVGSEEEMGRQLGRQRREDKARGAGATNPIGSTTGKAPKKKGKRKDSVQRLKEKMSSMTDDDLRELSRKIRGNDVINVFSAKQRQLEAISRELDRRETSGTSVAGRTPQKGSAASKTPKPSRPKIRRSTGPSMASSLYPDGAPLYD